MAEAGARAEAEEEKEGEVAWVFVSVHALVYHCMCRCMRDGVCMEMCWAEGERK